MMLPRRVPARDDGEDEGLDAAKARLDALGASPVQVNVGAVLAKQREKEAHEREVVARAKKQIDETIEKAHKRRTEALALRAEKAKSQALEDEIRQLKEGQHQLSHHHMPLEAAERAEKAIQKARDDGHPGHNGGSAA